MGEIPPVVVWQEVVMTQNPDLDTLQAAFLEVQSIATGSNHPQRLPIRNVVQPFIKNVNKNTWLTKECNEKHKNDLALVYFVTSFA